MKAVLDTSVVIASDLAPLPGELAICAATAHTHGARLSTPNADDLMGLEDLLEIAPV